MAEMTIRLRVNPNTGKKDILIDLQRDEDALPHEHEQKHRKLVERLVDGGALKASEVGQVVLSRDEIEVASEPRQAIPEETQRRSQQQGS